MDKYTLLSLFGWLTGAALGGTRETELLSGFCERLAGNGLPLWRVIVGIDTLHPVIAGRVVKWTDGADTTLVEYPIDSEPGQDKWERSPFHRLYTSRESMLRQRLTYNEPVGEYPIYDELRAQGATDYVAMVHHLGGTARVGEMDCVFSSWTTRAPGGFSDQQVAALEVLVRSLAIALHGRAMEDIARTLVETYLGRDAGARVLNGHIRRGVAEKIRAVLWFSDLQGFTRITDTADPALVIPLLNDYADALVTAIHGQGGQVLKFVGDGILAFFDMAGDGDDACARALAAEADARARCQEVNARRAGAGLPVTRFYLGLHVGEVFYGNVGSAERLDFTVIGPAVNEASRIAAMCRSLDQDTLLSSAFASAAPSCGERIISVGRYMLRGVGRPQELYTLDPGERR